MPSLLPTFLMMCAIFLADVCVAGPRTPCFTPLSQLWKTSQIVITGTVMNSTSMEIDYSDNYAVAVYRYYRSIVRVDTVQRVYSGVNHSAATVGDTFAPPIVGETVVVISWFAVTMLSEVSRDFRGTDRTPAEGQPYVFFLHYEEAPADFIGTTQSSAWRALEWTGAKNYVVNYPAGVQPLSFLQSTPMNASQLCHGSEPCDRQGIGNLRECKGIAQAFTTPRYRDSAVAVLQAEEPWVNPTAGNQLPTNWASATVRRQLVRNETEELDREFRYAEPHTYLYGYGCSYEPYDPLFSVADHTMWGYVLPIEFCARQIPTSITRSGYANRTAAQAPYLWRVNDVVEAGLTTMAFVVWNAHAGQYAVIDVFGSPQSKRLSSWYRLISQRQGSGPLLSSRNFLYFQVTEREFNPMYTLAAAGGTQMLYRDSINCSYEAWAACRRSAAFAQLSACSDALMAEYVAVCGVQTGGCWGAVEAHILELAGEHPAGCHNVSRMHDQVRQLLTAVGAEVAAFANETAYPTIPDGPTPSPFDGIAFRNGAAAFTSGPTGLLVGLWLLLM